MINLLRCRFSTGSSSIKSSVIAVKGTVFAADFALGAWRRQTNERTDRQTDVHGDMSVCMSAGIEGGE